MISGQQEAPGVAIPTFASLPHRLDANHRAGERERGHDDRGQVMKRRLSIGIIHRASNFFPATIVLVRFEERRPFLASSMLRHATTTTHDVDGRKNTLFLFAYYSRARLSFSLFSALNDDVSPSPRLYTMSLSIYVYKMARTTREKKKTKKK